MTSRSSINKALELYRREPWGTRAFLKGRVLLSDLELVERQVPESGDIIDLGCGHGLFANLMALRCPGRRVTGIDLAAGKIEHARATVGDRRNISFARADIMKTDLPAVDAVTIVDVLYLLPFDRQRELLAATRRKLKPGGVLVLKAQERRPRWKFACTYLQELLTTSVGLTRGGRGRFYFPDRQMALAMLRQAGFEPEIVEMPTWRPYTDILYLGRT